MDKSEYLVASKAERDLINVCSENLRKLAESYLATSDLQKDDKVLVDTGKGKATGNIVKVSLDGSAEFEYTVKIEWYGKFPTRTNTVGRDKLEKVTE